MHAAAIVTDGSRIGVTIGGYFVADRFTTKLAVFDEGAIVHGRSLNPFVNADLKNSTQAWAAFRKGKVQIKYPLKKAYLD